MAEDNSAANGKKIHDANAAKIAAQQSSNAAKATAVPSNVGRTEPAMDLNIMQGTANSVLPNRFLVTRIG
jgi:hypothetical protein